jgi:RNA polymerase sigma-70 factor (ECF subfamily)
MKNALIEEQVVRALKEGDALAFQTLYEEFGPRLQGFAARFRLPKEEVDELVQETFIRIWKHRQHINPSASFSTYIITIAKHLIYNQLKREGYKEKYIKELALQAAPGTPSDQNEWELRQLLEEALLELPEKCRLIFRKSRFEGISNQQIAESLGISKSTVENQLNKALKLVRKFLKARGYEV